MTGRSLSATLVVALFFLGLTVPANRALAAPTPEQIVATATKLDATTLDTSRTFPASGQVLDRDGMLATFEEGSFKPIAREDGRVVGLLFEGTGTLDVRIPAGVETTNWQVMTDFSPLEQPFNAAWLRFSDLTLDDLQGEHEWAEGSDAGGSAFRIHTTRQELLDNPQWTRRTPHLLVDRLQDLYAGAEGGHLLAEFRMSGDGPPSWLSYYHNNRGALMEGETTAWYRSRSRGGAPPLVSVLASFGEHSASNPQYDIAFIDLDMTFPTATKAGRNIVDTDVIADLGIVSLNPYGLETVVLELESQRNLCTGQSDRPKLKVRRVTDQDGNSLAAIHRKNRLIVPLAKKVARGEQVNLRIEYGGAVTQGIPIGPPDTSFNEIGPWAFYPRSTRIDRFASKVVLHLPRFISGVAPGDLIEERKEKDGWHFTYEEPGGIRTLMVVVGDLVRSKKADEGVNPRVITWVPRHIQEELKNASQAGAGMVAAVSNLWGGYPYSTLHVVQTTGHPYNNWQISNEGQTGLWSCLPPGPVHPWEAFIEQPSGMLVSSVISPPAFDVIESRFMDRYAVEGLKAGVVLQVMNLARQWWGHMVPPKTYRDLWITEAIVGWTGLAYVRGALEKSALKEKTRLLRDLAVEGHQFGVPMALGARADRQFLFDAWGRGPMLINSLIDELGGGPFTSTINTLVNRASGVGLSQEVLVEALGTVGSERTVELVKLATSGAKLPRLEVATEIDKTAGIVRVEVTQVDDPLPISLPLELVYSPKKVLNRMVKLEGPVTVVEWELPEMPKRVVVDPQGMAMVAGVKKAKASSGTTEETQ
ncbi:MAG: hypothetical protein KDA24_18955 [Deltaproteobacteria bacterium]|nr:hypothetical protein [Deltaproteobacteria bacterium]